MTGNGITRHVFVRWALWSVDLALGVVALRGITTWLSEGCDDFLRGGSCRLEWIVALNEVGFRSRISIAMKQKSEIRTETAGVSNFLSGDSIFGEMLLDRF